MISIFAIIAFAVGSLQVTLIVFGKPLCDSVSSDERLS